MKTSLVHIIKVLPKYNVKCNDLLRCVNVLTLLRKAAVSKAFEDLCQTNLLQSCAMRIIL